MARRRGGRPVPIGRLLRDVLARRGPTGARGLEELREAVEGALPDRLRGRVKLVAFRNGQVTLETDSSGLAYELHGFGGEELLARIKRAPGTEGVRKLRFKVGTSSHDR